MLQTRTKSKSILQDVELDEYGCLSLAEIIECFNAPISEEHAWALIYQCVKALDSSIRDDHICQPESNGTPYQPRPDNSPAPVPRHNLLSVLKTDQILIQEDGIIHHKTWCDCNNHNSNRPRPRENYKHRRRGCTRAAVFTEDKAISQFGVVIYSALDAGIGSDKERHLSSGLEEIIEHMALASGDDEGIESDQYDPEIDETPGLDHRNRGQPAAVNSYATEESENILESRRFYSTGTCKILLQRCVAHLSPASEPNIHFRAVCRALVAEAQEVSSFMTKVSKFESGKDDELMNELALQDWRRNFRQVMEDLRVGTSRLKKTSIIKTPIEYELTPYELLMEDIRVKKVELNKVEIKKDIRQAVPKNAHDVILHFIRSRPPLKPASERKLHPYRKESTPAEMLMESIRSSSARSSLRKTKGPKLKPLKVRLGYETSRCEEDEFENEEDDNDARRKVTLDPSLVKTMLNFSDDESEEESSSVGYSRQTSKDSTLDDVESVYEYAKRKKELIVNSSSPLVTKQNLPPKRSVTRTGVNYSKMAELLVGDNDGSDEIVEGIDESAKSKDKNNDEKTPISKKHQRRHSLTVCETPSRNRSDSESICSANWEHENTIQRNKNAQKIVLSTQISNMSVSVNSANSTSSVSNSRSSTPIESNLSDQLNEETEYDLNTPQMHANLHSEFLKSEDWAAALQTLELTLDEVVHIRSVLTKAELENLPLEGSLKDDLEKGKVCFLCMKTRFGFLRRGCKCELCQQQICNKCCTKMNIPSEHFSQAPVISLAGLKTEKMGSEPSSPMSHRHKMSNIRCENTDYSHESLDPSINLPDSQITPTETKRKNTDSLGAMSDRLKESSLTVCVDCKEMILQVIRAQSTARRIKMAKSLFDGEDDTDKSSDVFVNSDVWGEEFF